MQRHFFATADDLLPIFERVERKRELAYTLTGLFTSSHLSTVHSGAAIPTLRSPAQYPNAIAGPNYLVTPSQAAIQVRTVPQTKGGIRYAVDQLLNTDSVGILHGGVFGDQILLYGCISAASDTLFATQLYRAFASAIAKTFSLIQSYWVGPHAEALLRQGWRLTMGADAPPEYDLVV